MGLKKHHRERIERAIEFARTWKCPNGARFDMYTFGHHAGNHAPEEQNYCGTAACYAGWLSLDPWFRKRGLRGEWAWSYLIVRYRRDTDGDALMKFFGLDFDAILYVFGGQNAGTMKQAGKRLARVLANEGV